MAQNHVLSAVGLRIQARTEDTINRTRFDPWPAKNAIDAAAERRRKQACHGGASMEVGTSCQGPPLFIRRNLVHNGDT